MASRMDRYYKSELTNSERSSKNESLYKQIENVNNYTNIEGVATIEKTNEIDISKVRELLKNRENYKKQRQFKNIMGTEEEKEVPQEVEEEEEKNYDLNDILSKIKTKLPNKEKKYRSLDEEQYKFLQSLSKKDKKYDIDAEVQELEELINTISIEKKNPSNDSDDVGLLDELKSNTMVGDASSIKKIINSEKEISKVENPNNIDRSFYTSSFGFTSSDFEELKDINHKIKKTNKTIIILLISLMGLMLLGTIFFLIK